MLSAEFDQTTDWVYEVWNWRSGGDVLVGAFTDEVRADETELEMIVETGGGKVAYYPPIERYPELSPDEQAEALLTETISLLKRIEANYGNHHALNRTTLRNLRGASPDSSVKTGYDRDEFRTVIDEPALTETALDIVRAFRTLARIRHLDVYDERVLLRKEVELRDLLSEVNDAHLNDTE